MLKTTKENSEVGVIVARFQVAQLHDEHMSLINRVVNTHPRVFIFLGLAADACKCTYNNPLDFNARKAMIEKAFPTVEVFYIKDVGNNELWSRELDKLISTQLGPKQKAVLYGGRDSFVPHYRGRFPTEELVPNKFISGKEMRKNVGIRSKTTIEFREGVIWAVENQWPTVLPSVDGVILDIPTSRILLGRKTNNEGFQFVGGFARTTSDSFEDDILNRIEIETHLKVGTPYYIGSTKINDWRFRGEQNQIKTTLFVCKHLGGQPQADDDLAEAQWFDIHGLSENQIIPEHRPLLKMFMQKIMCDSTHPIWKS